MRKPKKTCTACGKVSQNPRHMSWNQEPVICPQCFDRRIDAIKYKEEIISKSFNPFDIYIHKYTLLSMESLQ